MPTKLEERINGWWGKWHTIVALISLAIVLAGFMFKAGFQDAAFEQKIGRLERDMGDVRVETVRKDVIEARLKSIEDKLDLLKVAQDRENDLLQKILVEQRKH